MKNEKYRKIWEEFVEEYKDYVLTSYEFLMKYLSNIKIFIDNNKKKPNYKAQYIEEKFLGHWLAKQIRNYKKKLQILANDNFRKIWEDFNDEYKEYLLTPKELWDSNLDKLQQFINNNQHLPKQNSLLNWERNLYSWFGKQTESYRKKTYAMKKEIFVKKWEKFMEDYKYLLSNDEIWKTKLSKLKKFMDDNKKNPSCKSKDLEEKTLGLWLFTQKNYKNETAI